MSADPVVGVGRRAPSLAGPRTATLFERLDARFVDTFLAAGVIGLLFALALMWTGDVDEARFYAVLASLGALPMLEMAFVYRRGATPGKTLKGMRVASQTSATGAPTNAQANIRSIVLLSLALTALVWWPLAIVYTLAPFTNRDRRGLHDVAAGTLVIRDPR